MGKKKIYQDPEVYGKKLMRIAERFGAIDLYYNYDRWSATIDLHFEDETIHFEHSVEQARANGIDLHYGSDAFAQLVLTLEDLARAQKRGTFKVRKVLKAMTLLPEPKQIPSYFQILEFEVVPEELEQVKRRHKELVKMYHPDVTGGDSKKFESIQVAFKQAIQHFGQ